MRYFRSYATNDNIVAMAHYVRGFVAEGEALHAIAQRYPQLRIVNLHRGLAFAPLTDECADSLTKGMTVLAEDAAIPNSTVLETILLRAIEMRLAADLSTGTRLIYIETEYWGGDGHQCAVGWCNGAIEYPLTYANGPGPINGALALVGVKAAVGRDEFDVVGLGHFRYMDWFEDQDSEYYKPNYLHACEARITQNYGRIRRWWYSLWH